MVVLAVKAPMAGNERKQTEIGREIVDVPRRANHDATSLPLLPRSADPIPLVILRGMQPVAAAAAATNNLWIDLLAQGDAKMQLMGPVLALAVRAGVEGNRVVMVVWQLLIIRMAMGHVLRALGRKLGLVNIYWARHLVKESLAKSSLDGEEMGVYR